MHTFLKSKKVMFLGALLIFTLGNVSGVSASTTLKEITAYLDNGIRLIVNGVPFNAKDEKGKVLTPINYEGNTYLPLRSVVEATGLNVKWDDSTRTATIGSKNEMNAGDFLVVSKDKKFQISLPSTWTRNDSFIAKINPLFKVGAVNNTTDPMQFFGIMSESKTGFSDKFTVLDYSELLIGQMNDEKIIDNLKVVSKTDLIIDGHKAKQLEITGVVNHINAAYLLTFVETENYFYQMTFWSAAKSIENSRADLTKITATFKELSD
ncbi:copper amine oxidase N-terminal domain-containing protein [Paenibacillus sp. HWE-109]|uniref:stalk domain-containing protein n=1 Tax=Paenibacillus sp. HWE-109 TaxID=1306526 RepID=UPI001EDD911A|nr:stalk domain-containing protein [Paenibacillus sp. HWE-109]UKS29936.1 copper amine oxidase N-terminal domain-containing protein [Paenibacillus sp. HWE-109]